MPSPAADVPRVEAELTPNGCVLSGVAGLARDEATAAVGRWLRAGGSSASRMKPWREPLPPPRASPKFTLADVLAKAQLGLWSVGECGASMAAAVRVPRSSSSPALSCLADDRGSKFESHRHETRDPGCGGRAVGFLGLGRCLRLRLGGKTVHVAFHAVLEGCSPVRESRARCMHSPPRLLPSLKTHLLVLRVAAAGQGARRLVW